ncbi:TPA: DUF3265 domain-containing protein [Vibrio vulnificus]|nr:DUF3265 domain-containing protein [Vibrio vulnificus]
MTRRLSGIHAAWHSWYAVSFSGESGLRKVSLCGTHPLTQRYIFLYVCTHKSPVLAAFIGVQSSLFYL